jgi:hypothetical protein
LADIKLKMSQKDVQPIWQTWKNPPSPSIYKEMLDTFPGATNEERTENKSRVNGRWVKGPAEGFLRSESTHKGSIEMVLGALTSTRQKSSAEKWDHGELCSLAWRNGYKAAFLPSTALWVREPPVRTREQSLHHAYLWSTHAYPQATWEATLWSEHNICLRLWDLWGRGRVGCMDPWTAPL